MTWSLDSFIKQINKAKPFKAKCRTVQRALLLTAGNHPPRVSTETAWRSDQMPSGNSENLSISEQGKRRHNDCDRIWSQWSPLVSVDLGSWISPMVSPFPFQCYLHFLSRVDIPPIHFHSVGDKHKARKEIAEPTHTPFVNSGTWYTPESPSLSPHSLWALPAGRWVLSKCSVTS